MKKCSRCREEKPKELFGKSSKARDGLQWHCKKCKAELHQLNHSSRMESIRAGKEKRRQSNRKYIVDYFATHPCIDCGNTDIRVLDFDHVSGDKVGCVASMAQQGYSLDKIKDEISKCEVRCKNCHAIKTYERLEYCWRTSSPGIATGF